MPRLAASSSAVGTTSATISQRYAITPPPMQPPPAICRLLNSFSTSLWFPFYSESLPQTLLRQRTAHPLLSECSRSFPAQSMIRTLTSLFLAFPPATAVVRQKDVDVRLKATAFSQSSADAGCRSPVGEERRSLHSEEKRSRPPGSHWRHCGSTGRRTRQVRPRTPLYALFIRSRSLRST